MIHLLFLETREVELGGRGGRGGGGSPHSHIHADHTQGAESSVDMISVALVLTSRVAMKREMNTGAWPNISRSIFGWDTLWARSTACISCVTATISCIAASRTSGLASTWGSCNRVVQKAYMHAQTTTTCQKKIK